MGVIGLALGTSIVISLTLGHLLLLLVALGLAQVSCPHHKQPSLGSSSLWVGFQKRYFIPKSNQAQELAPFGSSRDEALKEVTP